MYQLYVDGERVGDPAHEKTIDKIISRNRLNVTNILEKKPYVPELKLVVGGEWVETIRSRV